MKFKLEDGIRIVCSIGLLIGMWMGSAWCLYFNVTLLCVGTEIMGWVIKALTNKEPNEHQT